MYLLCLCPRPRLGSTLTKVVVVGGIYFVAAFIDGVARASKVMGIKMCTYSVHVHAHIYAYICTCTCILINESS